MSVLRDYAAAVSQPTLPFASAAPRFDEVVDADGTLRPAWQGLATLALGLTREELDRVDGEIARFLADDGVSYARAGAELQPWQLDPMPFVMDAAGWARLDVGLAQRAELLNALLADLYGPQVVLRERIVPAAVVLGHAGFVRAMARASDDAPPPDLLLSATDLGRDAAGDWHVLADRVQALETAFAQTMADQEFRADAARVNVEVDPLTGAQLHQLVMDYLSMPADVKATLQKVLRP